MKLPDLSPGRTAVVAIALAAGALLGGCASNDPGASRGTLSRAASGHAVTAFSLHPPDVGIPEHWKRVDFGAFKKPTDYQLVNLAGRTCVRASADASASMLVHAAGFQAGSFPILRWSWNVPALIESADNTQRQREDSPARIVIAFEGDSSRLPALERMNARQFQMLTGTPMPYATLMYIRGNQAAPGSIITSTHTDRIKMIVAESGSEGLGEWRNFSRNLVEDYRRAFGEAPGRVAWIGLMTDTDNTRETAHAYYGDVSLAALSR